MPATLSLSRTLLRSAARGALSAAPELGRRLNRFITAYMNRRQAALLSRLDDRMLADLGLNRADLRDALAEPLWRDPSNVLSNRVAERRRNCARWPSVKSAA